MDRTQLWGAADPQPLCLSITEGRQGAGGPIFPLHKSHFGLRSRSLSLLCPHESNAVLLEPQRTGRKIPVAA